MNVRRRVRYALQQGTRELVEPKTERSKRVLALDTVTVTSLREHRHRQRHGRIAAGSRWQDREFVFTTIVGSPTDHSNLMRHYRVLLERAGIPRQTFHQLLHACATLLLESGEELANISKLLGHSGLATTADFYGHLTPKISRRAADRMGEILAG